MSQEHLPGTPNIAEEIRCPNTGMVCFVLKQQFNDPGIQRTIYSDGSVVKTNNDLNAKEARRLAKLDSLGCETFQDELTCGAIYSKFISLWAPIAEIEDVKNFLDEEN